jgi:hypothetical protein
VSRAITLLLATLLVLASASPAQAEPVRVKVGMYMLSLGKFDVSSGSYVVDFYLTFRCDDDCSEVFERATTTFEFMNGRPLTSELIISEDREKAWRIRAELMQNIDLHSFPFDAHSLPIEIEDEIEPVDNLVYVVDTGYSGIDANVRLVGWALTGWSADVVDHRYPQYDVTYSRLIFSLGIERIRLSAILKLFMPVFFLVGVSLFALLVPTSNIVFRLSVTSSMLLAAVFFQLNTSSSIPPVGYLTFADKFMTVTYISLILNLLFSIVLTRFTDDEAGSRKIEKLAAVCVPGVTVLGYVVLFLA